MNLEQFIKKRNEFPAGELAKYAGKHVAWSPDGTQVLVADEDPLKVFAAVKAAGYDPGETLIEAVPTPEEVFWGGATLFQPNEESSE
jgi:hypothetical protein